MRDEIVVRYSSGILGSGEFWRGPLSKRSQIRNLPARWCADRIAAGAPSPQTDGMWTVARVTHDSETEPAEPDHARTMSACPSRPVLPCITR